MAVRETSGLFSTHDVTNQPPPLQNYNLFESDAALREGVEAFGGGWDGDDLRAMGELLGRPETIELGFTANKYTPELKTHDRFGHRLDIVDFHPAYHALMRIALSHKVHSYPWVDDREGVFVARAARFFMLAQIESGHGCPTTMTFAVVPALRHQPNIADEWIPRVTSSEYDPRHVPVQEKTGATMGMAMTEKQGGSDVRANTTRAVPLEDGGPGTAYELTGHKWFCSAPMCDAFLTLAQTEYGLSCFLVPRFLPDGTKNRFFIQRLKDKVGNRSNASSEIEYSGTWSVMVGEEGRGVPTIIDMVSHTRLDCIIGTAAIMRAAVAQAAHHTSHRAAFGKKLNEQPLMKNVLADMAIETEAATAFLLYLSRAYDDARRDPSRAALVRIATAIGKYWTCKRGPNLIYEAMECHGGAGYVEESILPRLYREAPLSSIWEGSGNVMCLDVLRAMTREPETVPALFAEMEKGRGGDKRLDAAIDSLKDTLRNTKDVESQARRIVEKMILALQGSVLVQNGNAAIADTFCATRLGGDWGGEYGSLPASTDFDAIVARTTPATA